MGVERPQVPTQETAGTVLTAWVPLQAPSMNTLLSIIWSQHRILTKPEIRLFRSQFKTYLPKWCLASTGPYQLSLTFHQPWYYLNGFPKKQDVPNLLKSCIDALCERYGIDDSLLWKVECEKVHDEQQVGIQVRLQ